ncbi:flagellin [Leclercia adecarboxylata]|nr:flagellin [Leclercia adecarboxylata]KMN61749.1 flagellin [Leclercia sp. LK8]
MAQVINTNALSLMAQNNLNKSQSTLGTAIQRLSSGLRINSAKDDAAGQAISNRFTANITGLSQASRNANDGISIAQTTEGALNEVNDNLQNIRRLTVQAENGTNSASDRQSIQDEINQRLAEIDRISDQTEFNGVKVLSEDQVLKIQVGANDGQTIDIQLNQMDATKLGMDSFALADGLDETSLQDVASTDKLNIDSGKTYSQLAIQDKDGNALSNVNVVTDGNGNFYATNGTDYYDLTNATYTAADGTLKVAGDKLTPPADADKFKDVSKDEYSYTSSANYDPAKLTDSSGASSTGTLVQDKTNPMNYYVKHVDANGNNTYTKATVKDDGSAMDTGTAVATGKKTQDPLGVVDKALAQVDQLRSGLGAVQNRFASVINNLNSTVNNLSESRSRILDADFASEVSEMSRSNILQSAGTTVLAQANQVPQNVLTLLR